MLLLSPEIEQVFTNWGPELCMIRELIGTTEVLAQLAEESAELAQAALKYRRALDLSNPTPVSVPDAQSNLQEEFADVLLCMMLTGVDAPFVRQTIQRKIARWYDRLDNINGNR